MGWRNSFVGGLILTIILLSMAASFTAYLVETDQSCPTTVQSTTTAVSTSSTSGNSSSLSPVPVVADDLLLSPLATLSLAPGDPAAVNDLVNSSYWKEVRASELQTYEQIVPQTVLGFYNSSAQWRAWVLQNLPAYSSWLRTGFVGQAQGQVDAVDPFTSGTNESGSAVEQGVRSFAASVAGVSLASLDFISFNGLTGLKTLFETNDPLLAACETLPGQLAQLYESSFESGIPQSERADFLGRALAITSVMVLVGGKDGFADQFGSAIDGLGLGDSWSTVKPYLGDIATKVSASASSATLAILQTLAQRFPQNSVFVTGFTADRIDSMVDVLEKKGVSNDVVQNDLGQIAQAAGSYSDDEAAGDEADALSLQQGGGIEVTVEVDGTIVRYDDGSGDKVTLDGLLLQILIPGFDPRGPEFVVIHIEESGVTIYRYYPAKNIPVGGPFSATQTNWRPQLPANIAQPGQTITISLGLLDTEGFLKSIPPILFKNEAGIQWVADSTEAKSFVIVNGQIQMVIEQELFQGVSSFTITATPISLVYSRGDTSLEFDIPNAVFTPRTLKVTFNGYGKASLSIGSGQNFNPIGLISSDGVRLKIVSDAGGGKITVSTIYLQNPSILYSPASMAPTGVYDVAGATEIYQIDQVTLTRALEQSILKGDSKYDIGIVGAEIALTVAQKNLGLTDIVMPPVVKGGADLYTEDGTVVIQARMLANPLSLGDNLQTVLTGQLQNMVNKLRTDFPYHPGATTGYAVLSYVDPATGVVRTLVAVVKP